MKKELIEEAKKCDNCLCWLKHCNAECCRQLKINMPIDQLPEKGDYIVLNLGRAQSRSFIKYLSYRDIKYKRGLIKIKRDRIKVINNELIYQYDCKMLNENLCTIHGKDKPAICKELTLETCMKKKFKLTDNCLYRYKLEGRENNGKKS